MVKVFKDDLKYINVFVILFKETDMRLDKVINSVLIKTRKRVHLSKQQT